MIHYMINHNILACLLLGIVTQPGFQFGIYYKSGGDVDFTGGTTDSDTE